MKYLPVLIMLITALGSCEKEINKQKLGAYFKFTINGVETVIENGSGLNSNIFSCDMYGDTALFVNVSKLYASAGFFIEANSIANGTYTLNNNNKGYYTNPVDLKRYSTNNIHTGQVTIQKGTFQANSVLNTLQGTFSFVVEDTATHNTINVSNGTFLMEVTQH